MKLTRIFLSLLFVLFATSTLQAKPSDPVPKDKVPFIQAVQVDFAANVSCSGEDSQATDTLTIRGVGFGLADGPSPVITLGQNIDDLLTVCFFSDEEVVAKLPVDTEDGDYLLSIVTAGGVGGFDLTIGAVGPTGADGADGNDGAPGTDGADGANGNDGAPGADGTDGADGATGPQGPAGPQGVVGPAGPQGLVGPAGPKGDVGPVGPAGPAVTYAIGGHGPAGGWVFYVTGDGLHGLEAAPSDAVDWLTGAEWGCYYAFAYIPGADGTAIGTGARNTDDIIRDCPTAGIAAALADNYVSPSGYFDWYLPSKDELKEMCLKIGWGNTNVGGFYPGLYWSSSEFFSKAWLGGADANCGEAFFQKDYVVGVRAVRAF